MRPEPCDDEKRDDRHDDAHRVICERRNGARTELGHGVVHGPDDGHEHEQCFGYKIARTRLAASGRPNAVGGRRHGETKVSEPPAPRLSLSIPDSRFPIPE